MENRFDHLFTRRDTALHLCGTGAGTAPNCLFVGTASGEGLEKRFQHFVTFKKECFSDSPKQMNLSIFVDPTAGLPEWRAIPTGDDFAPANSRALSLEFEQRGADGAGSKFGGEPQFIHLAQAHQFLEGLGGAAAFIVQLDEEDVLLTDEPGIDKGMRDILCGGAIYLFAGLDGEKRLLDFSTCHIDHQM